MNAKTHGMALIHECASPFGKLQVAWSERTKTLTLYQGGYLQSRSDRYGIAKVDYIHAIYELIRQGEARCFNLRLRRRHIGHHADRLGATRDHGRFQPKSL